MTATATRPIKPLADRLWSRVNVGAPNTCWVWLGATVGGTYGVIGRGRRGEGNILVHVAAYEDRIGPVPVGFQVDHVKARGCGSTLCCNPAHLEAVPQLENLRRQAEARTHCRRGHPFSDSNTYRRRDGSRSCRACHRDDVHAAKARRLLSGVS